MKQTSLLAAVRDRSIDLRCLVPRVICAMRKSNRFVPLSRLRAGCKYMSRSYFSLDFVLSHVIAEALEEASITGAPAELLLNGCINA